jgi:hypothetical protein
LVIPAVCGGYPSEKFEQHRSPIKNVGHDNQERDPITHVGNDEDEGFPINDVGNHGEEEPFREYNEEDTFPPFRVHAFTGTPRWGTRVLLVSKLWTS